jgi:hypothetical protein
LKAPYSITKRILHIEKTHFIVSPTMASLIYCH